MLEYIEDARKEIMFYKNRFNMEDRNTVEKKIYRDHILRGIEIDINSNQRTALIDSYCEYFRGLQIPTITISKNQLFYRGRVGGKIICGAIDDCDKEFLIPYYGNDILAVPPLYATGSRFNRDGVSYLYLATNIETALSEIHAEVGQQCSIAEFYPKEDICFLDISGSPENIELKTWYEVLTQPIYSEIRYKYRITQFISEVLSSINKNGIYFKSTQSTGHNLVCFNPENFQLKQYSEKLYITRAIQYRYDYHPDDSIDQYASKDASIHFNSYNEHRENTVEMELEYMEKWIEYRRRNSNKGEK